jgi:hypothetical protein
MCNVENTHMLVYAKCMVIYVQYIGHTKCTHLVYESIHAINEATYMKYKEQHT